MASKKVTKKWVGRKHGFKSGLEESISNQLKNNDIPVRYEEKESVISYIIPASKHTYSPDFILPNEIIVETKGRFVLADRKKHLLIKEQHPNLDIRFIFTNSKNKISKNSRTTYGEWCEKHGFKYADKLIPDSWLEE
jgi:isocitrate dehydrogenase kinase/phosphatase